MLHQCRWTSLAVPMDALRTSTASLRTRRDTVRVLRVSVGVPSVRMGTRGGAPRVPEEALPMPSDALPASCDSLAVPCDALAIRCDAVGIADDALLASCDAVAAFQERPLTPGAAKLTRYDASRVHRASPSRSFVALPLPRASRRPRSHPIGTSRGTSRVRRGAVSRSAP